MSFDPQFLSMMQTVAQWLPFTEDNLYGEPSFGAPVNIRCHVTYKRKIIRSDTEEDRISTAQIQCPPPGLLIDGIPTPKITIYDWIILPYDSIQRKIIDLTTYTDESTGGNPVNHQSAALE